MVVPARTQAVAAALARIARGRLADGVVADMSRTIGDGFAQIYSPANLF
jgi:hypothetical protein